jgi:hypothetical protein
LCLMTMAAGASGQVVSPLHRPTNLGIYGEATFQQPSFSDVADRVRGITVGGYLQSRFHIGIDVRAVALQKVAYYHEFSILAGPRVAFHFAHLEPYGSFDVGDSRESERLEPTAANGYSTETRSTKFRWCGLGGVDIHVLPHLSLRLPEVSYSDLYTEGGTNRSVTYGGGLVVRLR